MLCRAALGANRSSYVSRPAATSPDDLARFSFLGKLMGCALLQSELVLDLELCDVAWKSLTAEQLTEADLAGFDEAEANSLRRLRHIDEDGVDEEMFGELFFNRFECDLSDGSTVELVDGGASTDVTFANRGRFCDLAARARLHEGDRQHAALLAGIGAVVPAVRLLALLSSRELQSLVCSVADIDIGVLRAHTRYGAGVASDARHIRIFWKVLEGFTAEQRRQFLKFIWSRNRLPKDEQDWGEHVMRIHTLETRKPDGHFPVAHTAHSIA